MAGGGVCRIASNLRSLLILSAFGGTGFAGTARLPCLPLLKGSNASSSCWPKAFTRLRRTGSRPWARVSSKAFRTALQGQLYRVFGHCKNRAFTRLRRASYFLLSGHCAAGAARTAELAQRAEGRSPESEKCNQREGHPGQTLCGLPATAPCVALPPASMPSPALRVRNPPSGPLDGTSVCRRSARAHRARVPAGVSSGRLPSGRGPDGHGWPECRKCRSNFLPVVGHPGHGLRLCASIMRCRGTRRLLMRIRSARKPPWFVPSNAVGHGSKAPLFEATDGRVGAGPWTARNEGHIARHASDARNPGGLSLGYLSLPTKER
jgi:hypothetical protein